MAHRNTSGTQAWPRGRPSVRLGDPCKRRPARLDHAARNLVYTSIAIGLVTLALTGFVCTYKIQAEEECLSSNVLCYECDSRYEPNCADPFELPSISLAEQQTLAAAANNSLSPPARANNLGQGQRQQQQQQQQQAGQNGTQLMRPVKIMPRLAVCHGCCVKITSKTPEGAVYVKRTCTTSLSINFFMVGLVCMKESGDRGKMCFCETDYCNGQPPASGRPSLCLLAGLLLLALLVTRTRPSR